MTLAERLRAADRLQHAKPFKLGATILLALLAIGGFVAAFVVATSGDTSAAEEVFAGITDETVLEQTEFVRNLLESQGSLLGVGLAIAGGLVVWLAVVWLGAALTYLALAVVAGVLAGGAYLLGSEITAVIIAGIALLTQAFVVLLQTLRLLLGGANPIFAIARNVLAEAVRMKISLIFIVLLIFGLSLLPSLLDEAQPLRYRVQSFLQWSAGGSFTILAVLTMLFSIASVSGEQRERIIWQTVTKPVAAWQYLLGKWLGVSGLVAVLLLVSASGIFLFTEYLRNQPAQGESEAYIAEGQLISDDRLILETRVLTARKAVTFEQPPELDPSTEDFLRVFEARLQIIQSQDPDFGRTDAQLAEFREETLENLELTYRTVQPGMEFERLFVFENLGPAEQRGGTMNFTYQIEAEGNAPDKFYKVTFVLPDGAAVVRNTGLGYDHTLTLPTELINDEGVFELRVINGELGQDRLGRLVFNRNNQYAFRIPKNGFEVSYAVGGYQLNYLRAMTVLWVKLAFVGAIGVFMGSFLSFPVACLCGFGVFALAEMSSWLGNVVEMVGTTDARGQTQIHKLITTPIADAVSKIFYVYGDMNPVARLVDGRLLSWGDLALGVGSLGAVSLALYGLSILVFSRRELALYSGQ